MSDSLLLTEPLLPSEVNMVAQRTADSAAHGGKYQDVSKRVANTLKIMLEGRRFTDAFSADAYMLELGLETPEKGVMFLRRAMDISDNGQYLQWLCSRYARNEFSSEDSQRVQDALRRYSERRLELPVQDILSYKTFADLEEALSTLEGDSKQLSKRQQKREMKQAGSFRVFDGDNGTVVGLKTPEAATFYAANTRWCTSSANGAMFGHYYGIDELFVFLPKSGRKYQLHDDRLMFMDAEDRSILTDLRSHAQRAQNWESHPLKDDFQFIVESLPSTFATKTINKLGLSVRDSITLDSENPKEQAFAIRTLPNLDPQLTKSCLRSHRSHIVFEVLKRAKLSVEDLRECLATQRSADDQGRIVSHCLSNPNASDDLLSEIVANCATNHPSLSYQVFDHRNVGVKTVVKAYMSGNTTLVKKALLHEDAPAKMFSDAIQKYRNDDSIVSLAIQSNHLPYEAIREFLLSKNPLIRRACYRHKDTPSEVLLEASKTELGDETREIILAHKNAPAELLSQVFASCGYRLQAKIALSGNLSASMKELILRSNVPVVCRAFLRSNAVEPGDVRTLFANSQDLTVKGACVIHPLAPLELVKSIIDDPKQRRIAQFAVQNPNVNLDLLLEVAKDNKDLMLRNLARSQFEKLGGDKSLLPAKPKFATIYV